MTKKTVALIILLVAVIGALVAGLIYDRDEALIARTQPLPLGQDGIEVVEMHKHGFIFHRSGYEAKISIPHDHPEDMVQYLADLYQFDGELMLNAQYQMFCEEVFDGSMMEPVVEEGTNVWVQGAGVEDGANVVNIIVSEDSTHAYLYVYYHA